MKLSQLLVPIVCAATSISFPAVVNAQVPTTQVAATTRPAQTPVLGENTVLHADVPYGGPDAQMDVMDVYSPRGASGAPIVLFIHGGEWSRGDKRDISFKPRFFNAHNIVFAAANYRLSPKNPHPAQVDDVATAIAFLHKQGTRFGGDGNKIVIIGHSAGCHLVSYVSLNPDPLNKVGMTPGDIRGTVAWSGGMYNLPVRYKLGGMYKPFIAATFGDDEASQLAGSPIHYVDSAASAPPFLIASVDDEKSQTSREASDDFRRAIQSHGGRAQSAVLNNRTHFTANHLLGSDDDQTGPMLLQFIESVTK